MYLLLHIWHHFGYLCLMSRGVNFEETCQSRHFVWGVERTSNYHRYEDLFWGGSREIIIGLRPANKHFLFLWVRGRMIVPSVPVVRLRPMVRGHHLHHLHDLNYHYHFKMNKLHPRELTNVPLTRDHFEKKASSSNH